jgi:hypothetical protein
MPSETRRSESDFGICKTLFERLAGSNGDYWRKALNRFNRKEDPFKLREADVWLKMPGGSIRWEKEKLMAPRTAEEKETGRGYEFTEWAVALARPLVLPETVEEAWFVKGKTDVLFGMVEMCHPYTQFTPEFLARFNLEPCQKTDVFFLRPNYSDQPEGEYATIWSEVMIDGEKNQLFTLGHHSELGKLVHVDETHEGCSEGGATYIFRMKRS